MSKETELSLKAQERIFIKIPKGELVVSRNAEGEVRISIDNYKLGIYPNGSNSIYLKVEK